MSAERDTSSVFHRAMLDEEAQKQFAFDWIFETDEDGCIQFSTEDAACAAQRLYRRVKGFHPITGERDGLKG